MRLNKNNTLCWGSCGRNAYTLLVRMQNRTLSWGNLEIAHKRSYAFTFQPSETLLEIYSEGTVSTPGTYIYTKVFIG